MISATSPIRKNSLSGSCLDTRRHPLPCSVRAGLRLRPAPAGRSRARRRRRRADMGVERLLEELAGFEREHAPRADRDGIASLWVASLPFAFVAQHEVPEAADLDDFPATERLLHQLENEVDQIRRLLLRE